MPMSNPNSWNMKISWLLALLIFIVSSTSSISIDDASKARNGQNNAFKLPFSSEIVVTPQIQNLRIQTEISSANCDSLGILVGTSRTNAFVNVSAVAISVILLWLAAFAVNRFLKNRLGMIFASIRCTKMARKVDGLEFLIVLSLLLHPSLFIRQVGAQTPTPSPLPTPTPIDPIPSPPTTPPDTSDIEGYWTGYIVKDYAMQVSDSQNACLDGFMLGKQPLIMNITGSLLYRDVTLASNVTGNPNLFYPPGAGTTNIVAVVNGTITGTDDFVNYWCVRYYRDGQNLTVVVCDSGEMGAICIPESSITYNCTSAAGHAYTDVGCERWDLHTDAVSQTTSPLPSPTPSPSPTTTPTPPTLNCPNNCSHHGICDLKFECQCIDEWSGLDCSIPPPPKLISARFQVTLVKINVGFDRVTDRAGGITACGTLFTAATDLLGVGSECTWADSQTLTITLGTGATIKAGDTLTLASNVVYSPDKLKAASGSAVVEAATELLIPTAIVQAPSEIGECDGVQIDGTQSRGSGGRPLEFRWSVAFEKWTGSLAQQIALGAKIQNTNSSTLLVIANDFPAGSIIRVSLVAVNFAGGTSSPDTVRIEKIAKPLPIIEIAGDVRREARVSEAMSLSGSARVSVCAVNEQNLDLEWSQVSGPNVTLNEKTKRTDTLFIPAYSFPAVGSTYVFQLTGCDSNSTSTPVCGSSRVNVTVVSSDLIAIISGAGTVGRLSSFKLSGESSRDPDHPTATLSYYWSTGSRAAVVDFPARSLPLGTNFISLTVSNAGRNATTSTTVTILAEPVPIVQIKPLGRKVNADEKLRLEGSAVYANGSKIASIDSFVNYNWTYAGGDGLVDFDRDLLTRRDRTDIVFKPGVLAGGSKYVFDLSAKTLDGVGKASIEVQTNTPPSSGTCTCSPSVGISLNTTFTLACTGFEDDLGDFPLTYLFSYLNQGTEIPLGTASEANKVNYLLPEGNPLLIRMTISDRFGCKTYVEVPVTVKPVEVAVSQLESVTDRLLADAKREKSSGQIQRVVLAVSNSLNALSEPDDTTENLRSKLMDAVADVINDVELTEEQVESQCKSISTVVNSTSLNQATQDKANSAILSLVQAADSNGGLTDGAGVAAVDGLDKVVSSTISAGQRANASSTVAMTAAMRRKQSCMKANQALESIGSSVTKRSVCGEAFKTQGSSIGVNSGLSYIEDIAGSDITLPGLGSTVSVPKALKNVLSSESESESKCLGTQVRSSACDPNALLSNLNQTTVAPVVSVSLGIPLGGLKGDESIDFQIPLDQKMVQAEAGKAGAKYPYCKFWAGEIYIYGSDGCQTLNRTNETLFCRCSHLTSFTAIMDDLEFRPLTVNIIDPVADAKLLLGLLDDPFVVIVFGSLLGLAIVLALLGYRKDQVETKIFAKQFEEFTSGSIADQLRKARELDKTDDSDEAVIFKVLERVKTDHAWLAIYFRDPFDPVARWSYVFMLFIDLLAALTMNALFYSEQESNTNQEIMIGLLSTVIIFPVGIFFARLYEWIGRPISDTVQMNRAKISIEDGSGSGSDDDDEKKKKEKEKEKESVNMKDRLYKKVEGILFSRKEGTAAPVEVVATDDKEDEEELTPEQRRNRVIISLVWSGVIIAIFIYFLLIYGVKFEKETRDSWLFSDIYSTAADSIVSEPFKIVLRAVVIAILSKSFVGMAIKKRRTEQKEEAKKRMIDNLNQWAADRDRASQMKEEEEQAVANEKRRIAVEKRRAQGFNVNRSRPTPQSALQAHQQQHHQQQAVNVNEIDGDGEYDALDRVVSTGAVRHRSPVRSRSRSRSRSPIRRVEQPAVDAEVVDGEEKEREKEKESAQARLKRLRQGRGRQMSTKPSPMSVMNVNVPTDTVSGDIDISTASTSTHMQRQSSDSLETLEERKREEEKVRKLKEELAAKRAAESAEREASREWFRKMAKQEREAKEREKRAMNRRRRR